MVGLSKNTHGLYHGRIGPASSRATSAWLLHLKFAGVQHLFILADELSILKIGIVFYFGVPIVPEPSTMFLAT